MARHAVARGLRTPTAPRKRARHAGARSSWLPVGPARLGLPTRSAWAARGAGLWRSRETRIVLAGLTAALALVLVGSLLPPGARASASPDPRAISPAALVKLVSAQGAEGLTPAERDRAAAAAWLAAMQQLTALTAADSIHVAAPAGQVAAAQPSAAVAQGPLGVVLPGQAALDVAAAQRLLASLPAGWTLLAKASLLKNNDRIGNRDDEWSRADRTVVDGTPRASAVELLASFGFGLEQWSCLDRMWWQESNWNPTDATGATYGIPQALPGTKMAAAGPDWRTNPVTQIRWGLAYIRATYGTPCDAWTFWSQHYWY